MKIKILFAFIISLLLVISIGQIFNIPPYAEDVFPLYRSGYFSELERSNNVIADSFLEIKTMSETVYGWIFLDDIEKKYEISVDVYDMHGYRVPAPRERGEKNRKIADIVRSKSPRAVSAIEGDSYIYIKPIVLKNRCMFCHKQDINSSVAGALVFKRKFDAFNYYTSERKIIFIVISIFLCAVLFMLFRWDPERVVKEMFDK